MNMMVINGPNLNILGKREPELYGAETLEQINGSLMMLGKETEAELEFCQSNIEGELVNAIQTRFAPFRRLCRINRWIWT